MDDSKLRQEICDLLRLAQFYADMGQNLVDLGDDVGAEYAIKMFAAHGKTAIGFFNELRAARKAQKKVTDPG